MNKKDKSFNIRATNKSEAVPEKDQFDMEPTRSFLKNNPYKTPPNNITKK